jgi:hypothetical protein
VPLGLLGAEFRRAPSLLRSGPRRTARSPPHTNKHRCGYALVAELSLADAFGRHVLWRAITATAKLTDLNTRHEAEVRLELEEVHEPNNPPD